MYADDTIAAIATPPGQGGIGIVRVSGPRAPMVAASVFAPSANGREWASHHLYHGHVRNAAGEVIDQGLAVLMRAPRSYTGEDVLELHCHGSPVVLQHVLSRVLSCGVRLAEPGEFSKRAFLNGRLDLAQAEAVIDLVRARNEAGAELAMQQVSGRLSEHLAALRGRLVQLKALLEAQIDFSEEDFEVDAAALVSECDACTALLKELIDTYEHGKLMRDGIRVAIVGKPNVGKSSLLNALLGENRAIVTEIPGTTRDALDEWVDFDGFPVVLSDTAGLREHRQADPVELEGMSRTAGRMADAQLVLAVVDASRPLDSDDRAVLNAAGEKVRIIVCNKIDLPFRIDEDDLRQLSNGGRAVQISAKLGRGLEDLRRAVVEQATCGSVRRIDGPILTQVRHRDAALKAARSLELARQSLMDRRPPDITAVDVQDAIDHIGEITGLVTSEEVLDHIFSQFCVGK